MYAKQSGMSSFSSLWAIKHALDTTKVGHTGTLDNFADGLLVVLTNRMRKFVSHVTDFDKSYEAILKFGEETDTLDRTGTVVSSAPLPTEEAFRKAVSSYVGAQQQVPPVYSAIQVNGRRASDLVRSGRDVSLPARNITIYSNEVVAFTPEYAHIRVSCSKGTYIRALARDLADLSGTKAHLVALRRTKVGPFALERAACFSFLPEFSIQNLPKLIKDEIQTLPQAEERQHIQQTVVAFTPQLASLCGLKTVFVKPEWLQHFLCGKPLKPAYFENFPLECRDELVVFAAPHCVPEHTEPHASCCVQMPQPGENADTQNCVAEQGSVYERLCGVIHRQSGGRIRYVFVIQDELPPANPVRKRKTQEAASL